MTEREIAEIGRVSGCRIDEAEEALAGCGGPKDESPTVAVPVASSDNREAKLSP